MILMLLWSIGMAAQPIFKPENMGEKSVGELGFRVPRTMKFGFTNTGNEPLLIKEIHPFCGCVQATWPVEPIQPNMKGEIVVVFDAKLLGTFDKCMAVYTNASEKPEYLFFHGRVVPKLPELINDSVYPYDLGNVRMSTNRLDYEKVQKGQIQEQTFRIYNVSQTPYRPNLMHLPAYLSVSSDPEIIAPECTGQVTVKLDSRKLPRLGLTQASVYLAGYTENLMKEGEIAVTAVLYPDFSRLTAEQRAKAGRLQISEHEVTLPPSKKPQLKYTLVLTNTGQSVLKIHAMQKYTPAIQSLQLGKMELKPGERTKLKIIVDQAQTEEAMGAPCRILLICDDPENPLQYVNLTLTKE